MTTKEVVGGFRQALADLVAPELREVRAELRCIREDLRAMDARNEKRFDAIDARLNDHDDVQTLKMQMAEMRARQQPSA